MSLSGGAVVKNPPDNAADVREKGLILGSGRTPRGRDWQPTPVFLPEESHGQRSLVNYSLRVCKESNVTEQLTLKCEYMFSCGKSEINQESIKKK